MSSIGIEDVSKRFGDYEALARVRLEVSDGEFFSLLGPSGSGKTTLLNIIAGFLAQDGGRVLLGTEDVSGVPSYKRNIGMVFQSYALFPHMSVADNVAYGLRLRKMPRADAARRVREVLQLVQLDGYAQRMPRQLSGGQQQRVAIARALAIRPRVLLLDEPLSNLDAKLRRNMQFELRRLQRSTGITTVLVTHDQEEALSLSDRVGILGDGVLQQVGPPKSLYEHPANRFVAGFVGEANLLETAPGSGRASLCVPALKAGDGRPLALELPEPGHTGLVMLRPESITLTAAGEHAGEQPNQALVTIGDVGYTGTSIRIQGELAGGGHLIAQVPGRTLPELPAIGDRFVYSWAPQDLIALN